MIHPMRNQCLPIILGTGYTNDSPPVPALAAIADIDGCRLSTAALSGGGLTTATGSGLYAWLLLPHADEDFAVAANCPTSLRLWRVGFGSTGAGFANASYRLGIARPATYTPNTGTNGPTGTFDLTAPGTFDVDWLSPETADAGPWAANTEQVLTLTHNGSLIPTYNRGQVVMRVKLPSADLACSLTIHGVGLRS